MRSDLSVYECTARVSGRSYTGRISQCTSVRNTVSVHWHGGEKSSVRVYDAPRRGRTLVHWDSPVRPVRRVGGNPHGPRKERKLQKAVDGTRGRGMVAVLPLTATTTQTTPHHDHDHHHSRPRNPRRRSH